MDTILQLDRYLNVTNRYDYVKDIDGNAGAIRNAMCNNTAYKDSYWIRQSKYDVFNIPAISTISVLSEGTQIASFASLEEVCKALRVKPFAVLQGRSANLTFEVQYDYSI